MLTNLIKLIAVALHNEIEPGFTESMLGVASSLHGVEVIVSLEVIHWEWEGMAGYSLTERT